MRAFSQGINSAYAYGFRTLDSLTSDWASAAASNRGSPVILLFEIGRTVPGRAFASPCNFRDDTTARSYGSSDRDDNHRLRGVVELVRVRCATSA